MNRGRVGRPTCDEIPDRMAPCENAKRRVVAVALEGFVPLDLAAVTSVFAARRPSGDPLYAFVVCGLEAGLVNGADGFTINAVRPLSAVDDADMIIVPGHTRIDSVDHQPLRAALRRAYERGASVVGIPRDMMEPVNSGVDEATVESRCVVAPASSMATFENYLRVVRADWGEVVADEVARELVGHRQFGGRAQTAESERANPAAGAFLRTLEWMSANAHRPITIGTAAARACMSKRHFMRRFSQQTGMAPMQWILDRRVLAAQDLLVSSDLPLKQIAARVGFPSVRALRDQFKRRTGRSAVVYREEHRRGSR